MKSNRRNFIKYSGLTGISLAGAGMINSYGAGKTAEELTHGNKPHKQLFNMSGYAATKLETVRIGFIGLGNRGPAALERMKILLEPWSKLYRNYKISGKEKFQNNCNDKLTEIQWKSGGLLSNEM